MQFSSKSHSGGRHRFIFFHNFCFVFPARRRFVRLWCRPLEWPLSFRPKILNVIVISKRHQIQGQTYSGSGRSKFLGFRSLLLGSRRFL